MRLLLRGGLLADAIAATTEPADVLTDGPRIAAILPPGATPAALDAQVIDLAPGSVVCPGFIDAHAHAEGPLLASGWVEGALAQGVTTLVVGQDGQSWIGASAPTAGYLNRYFAPVNGFLGPATPLTVAGYAAAVSGRLAQNVAVLASQGTIRHNVAGLRPDPLDPAQLAAARREVEQALAEGAVGLSSGLDYLPSRHGTVDEIAELARPLVAAGRPYVSHLRGYGPDVRAGLAELAAVGHRSGARVHASHLWGEPAAIQAALDQADAEGVAVTFDMYPYRRSSTILPVLLLPPQVQSGGPTQTLAALTDPGSRAALLGSEKFSQSFLATITLGCLPPEHAHLAGLTLTEAARQAGQPAGEWTLDLLVRCDLNVGAHLDRPTLTDDHLTWLAHHPRHSVGSDGIYQGTHPHPRSHAAFAQLARQYTAPNQPSSVDERDRYQQLARHLAANPADVYGLRDRGRLAPGLAADICVITPTGLTPHATYESPTLPATGVTLILVNGEITHHNGHRVPTTTPGHLVH